MSGLKARHLRRSALQVGRAHHRQQRRRHVELVELTCPTIYRGSRDAGLDISGWEKRKSIARELHDGAVQQLAVLTRGLDEITALPPADTRELARLQDLTKSTMGELRQFSRDLRPALLDDLGLVAALQWLVNDVKTRTGTRAKLIVKGDGRRLQPELEIALYRITQEALRNVEHHAGSNHVFVTVWFKSDRILVTVEDDGNGFQVPTNLKTLVSAGKLGLIRMQERSSLVGGRFTVLSDPENGTLVTVDIPT